MRTALCHCGKLRLTATGEPEWVNLCYCQACQRRTGAPLHAGTYFAADRVEIDGDSKSFARPADSGYTMTFRFCPHCGSNLYWLASRFPRHIGVAVGGFADPEFPAPSFSVFEKWKHPWLGNSETMDQFPEGRTGPPLGHT
ncbi:MAG: aldehyde-activating protein [Alphaproteobacteria bacterium]|nr:aldehyde-activating protein [Alphaproteobacteria bacterium]